MKKAIAFLLLLLLLCLASCGGDENKDYFIAPSFADNCTLDGNNVTVKAGTVFTVPQAKLVDSAGVKYKAEIVSSLVSDKTGMAVTDAYFVIGAGDSYTLTYHVTDASLGVADAVYHIVGKDSTAPTITIAKMPEKRYEVGAEIVFEVSAVDDDGTPVECKIEASFAQIESSKGNSVKMKDDVTLVLSSEGYYHITVSATDASGNRAEERMTVQAVKNAISLKNYNLVSYTISARNGSSWENYAKRILTDAFSAVKETYPAKTGAGKHIYIECNSDGAFDPEYFSIDVDKDFNVIIYGGIRGVAYGAYELLERCGFGFYTPTLTVYPEEYISLMPSDLICHATSGFRYRSLHGQTMGQDWSILAKFRLNSLWGRTDIPVETYGGTYSYAGVQAHTMTGEKGCLLADYVDSHPEYFALVDGRRLTDRMGQMCFSSEEAEAAILAGVRSWLAKAPTASLVSLTLGDNHNYCQCDNCRAKYSEGYTVSDLYMGIVDRVARAIKYEYPGVLVQCFSYGGAAGAPTKVGKVSDNIIVQYCVGGCKAHAMDDETCPINKAAREDVQKWSEICSHLMVWDYPNNFKYQLASTPQIKDFLANARYFYEQGAFGLFEEYIHANDINGCCFDELKSYLLTKVMWNPLMTEDEYESLIADFMEAYYGEGWASLYEYIKLYESTVGRADLHFNYNMGLYTENGEVSGNALTSLIPKDQVSSFLARAKVLWEAAKAKATPEQLDRIRKDEVQLLYLEQCLTMQNILDNGTPAEKQVAIAKNEALINRIKTYGLKITFWGVPVSVQNASLDKNVSPLDWNYTW